MLVGFQDWPVQELHNCFFIDIFGPLGAFEWTKVEESTILDTVNLPVNSVQQQNELWLVDLHVI